MKLLLSLTLLATFVVAHSQNAALNYANQAEDGSDDDSIPTFEISSPQVYKPNRPAIQQVLPKLPPILKQEPVIPIYFKKPVTFAQFAVLEQRPVRPVFAQRSITTSTPIQPVLPLKAPEIPLQSTLDKIFAGREMYLLVKDDEPEEQGVAVERLRDGQLQYVDVETTRLYRIYKNRQGLPDQIEQIAITEAAPIKSPVVIKVPRVVSAPVLTTRTGSVRDDLNTLLQATRRDPTVVNEDLFRDITSTS